MGFFVFHDSATTGNYTYRHTRSLHGVLPILGGLADVPVVEMGELAQACASAGFRHACEAEIDAIGKDDGEQRIAVVGLPARTTMDEAFAEPDRKSTRLNSSH